MVIVSAARYEAEPLLSAFPDWNYIECGVGIFAASAAAMRNFQPLQGQDILYVGSCGSFKPFHNIEVVRGDSIVWLPTCERMSASYTVADTPTLAVECLPKFSSIPRCQVICAPNISKQLTPQDERQQQQVHYADLAYSETPSELAFPHCASVENIEAYAFFYPIHASIRSAQILLAITNQVGEKAHQQWQKNYLQAAEQVQQVVCRLIGRD